MSIIIRMDFNVCMCVFILLFHENNSIDINRAFNVIYERYYVSHRLWSVNHKNRLGIKRIKVIKKIEKVSKFYITKIYLSSCTPYYIWLDARTNQLYFFSFWKSFLWTILIWRTQIFDMELNPNRTHSNFNEPELNRTLIFQRIWTNLKQLSNRLTEKSVNINNQLLIRTMNSNRYIVFKIKFVWVIKKLE